MEAYNWIIIASWAVFLVYWGFAAFGVKKDTRKPRVHGWLWRFVLLGAIVMVVAYFPSTKHFFEWRLIMVRPLAGWSAAACSVVGIGIAVWARVYLGSDWSSHPDVKEGHKLVTSGPYAFVRHPIYTGMLLALVGSVLISNAFGSVVAFIAAVVLLARIPVEERYMRELFPDAYRAYAARTKRLVPFVW